MTEELTGAISVAGEALTTTGNVVTVTLSTLPDFAPILEYFSQQVMVFVQNPMISFFIAMIVGWIIAFIPAKYKQWGMGVSIVVSIALIYLVSLAGEVITNLPTIILLGLILGVVTSAGYDYAKDTFKKKESDEDLKKKSNIEDRDPNDYPEDAGFDRPDKKDYLYEALFGIDYALTRPNYINLAEGLFVQNQGEANIPSTSMACNGYGMAQGVNGNNTLDDGVVFVYGSELWKRFYEKYNQQYKANGIDMLTEGSYKQDMLTFARDSEIIIAYFLCKSADDICENLARGRAIHTGSNKIDWKATKLNAGKIAVIDEGAAHIFAIVGYDDSKKLFICMNSRGDKWADKGFFYLRYEDFNALYTSHALFDFDDQPILDAAMTLKDEILTEAKRKIEAGEKLTVREKIALRNRGFAHLIP